MNVQDMNVQVALRRNVAPSGFNDILVTLKAPPLPGAAQEEKEDVSAPRRTILVLDRSGSMVGAPYAMIKKAARFFVRRSRPQDYVGIIFYDDRVSTYMHLKSTPRAEEHLKHIPFPGVGMATNIGAAMAEAINMFKSATGGGNFCDRIILMSDGNANFGLKTAGDIIDVMTEGGPNVVKTISVYTIYLGMCSSVLDNGIMTGLADHFNGTFQQCSNEDGLFTCFGDIDGQMRSQVLSDVVIEIDGVRHTRSAMLCDEEYSVLVENVKADQTVAIRATAHNVFDNRSMMVEKNTFVAAGDPNETIRNNPVVERFVAINRGKALLKEMSRDRVRYEDAIKALAPFLDNPAAEHISKCLTNGLDALKSQQPQHLVAMAIGRQISAAAETGRMDSNGLMAQRQSSQSAWGYVNLSDDDDAPSTDDTKDSVSDLEDDDGIGILPMVRTTCSRNFSRRCRCRSH